MEVEAAPSPTGKVITLRNWRQVLRTFYQQSYDSDYQVFRSIHADLVQTWKYWYSRLRRKHKDDVSNANALSFDDIIKILKNEDQRYWEPVEVLGGAPTLRVWVRKPRVLPNVDCVRLSGFIPDVTPDDVKPLLMEPSQRSWDHNYSEFREITRTNNSVEIYAKVAVPRIFRYIAVPRDFLQVYTLEHIENGYQITAHSVEDTAVPENAGIIRGKLLGQVSTMKREKDGETTGTRVTITSLNDPKMTPSMLRVQRMALRMFPSRWFRSLCSAAGVSNPSMDPIQRDTSEYLAMLATS